MLCSVKTWNACRRFLSWRVFVIFFFSIHQLNCYKQVFILCETLICTLWVLFASSMSSVMFRPFMNGMVTYHGTVIWWTLTFCVTHAVCVYTGDVEVRAMFVMCWAQACLFQWVHEDFWCSTSSVIWDMNWYPLWMCVRMDECVCSGVPQTLWCI